MTISSVGSALAVPPHAQAASSTTTDSTALPALSSTRCQTTTACQSSACTPTPTALPVLATTIISSNALLVHLVAPSANRALMLATHHSSCAVNANPPSLGNKDSATSTVTRASMPCSALPHHKHARPALIPTASSASLISMLQHLNSTPA